MAPSWTGPGTRVSSPESRGVVGEDGGGAEKGGEEEEMRSRRDLHWWASLECLRQEAFFMIFSKAGVRTKIKRESASEEAIPEQAEQCDQIRLENSIFCVRLVESRVFGWWSLGLMGFG